MWIYFRLIKIKNEIFIKSSQLLLRFFLTKNFCTNSLDPNCSSKQFIKNFEKNKSNCCKFCTSSIFFRNRIWRKNFSIRRYTSDRNFLYNFVPNFWNKIPKLSTSYYHHFSQKHTKLFQSDFCKFWRKKKLWIKLQIFLFCVQLVQIFFQNTDQFQDQKLVNLSAPIFVQN